MKYKYTDNQIVGPLFKYNPSDKHLSWLDYEKLWKWQESFFIRLGYNDGFYISCLASEVDKIKNKNRKK